MTLTVTLPKDIEQAYVTAARSKGVSVDVLIEDLLVSHAPATKLPQQPETGHDPHRSPAGRAAAFRAWAESHPRTTPVLSDDAISRETIYSTRG